jgi:GH15 family glucan-1,4-alpha-glucosidase
VSQHPIADYALISDCNGSALVRRDGSVDWLCMPRFDSPSVLARLLDDGAGHWIIRPAGEATADRRYLDQSMVLQTTFRNGTGVVTVTDAMALGANERGHELGNDAPHALLREVTCVSGRVELAMEFAPRPAYGVVVPQLLTAAGGAVAQVGADVFALSAPLPLQIEDGVEDGMVRARFQLEAGQRVGVALQYAPAGDQPRLWTQDQVRAGIEDTLRGWRSWSAMHQSYQGPWQDEVRHSGRVLQALTYAPTGAIVAAPTTSLPETVGGERNWDYRYVWVRDASFTLRALWVAACPDEAGAFFSFMVNTAAEHVRAGTPLQIMFGIDGEHDLTERRLDHLTGWRGSRPVRVGNAAWRQLQLDVYGELLDAAHRLQPQLGELDEPTRRFLIDLADGAAAHWQAPDQGIWEVRGGPQHFLYSKLMCWVALDRAIALADWLRATDRLADWGRIRAEIRAAIEQQGWNPHLGAYTQAFGSEVLDASALMMPIVGFVPATDERMWSTIATIRRRLTDRRGLVYRYLDTDDGLTGDEGTFLLCTFWLSRCLALAGDIGQARAVFETAAGHANDVGLLAEEVDPDSGELLGNFPQAFSHIGLINAAWTIAQAEGVG